MVADRQITLRDVERCLAGTIPATISTCSPEGLPNITYLSIVHRLDDAHVALSFQFFNKTRENVQANPRAQLLLVDPPTGVQYRVDISYERTETEGPVFERMRVNLAAIASQTGMAGVFRLRGADIYRVLAIEELAHDLDLSPPDAPADFVAALETLSARLAECDDLEALLDSTLAGLEELLGYRSASILFADGAGTRLYTVASRGFPESGVGAEVAFGEGLIGTAALERRAVRVANLHLDRIMAEAVRTSARERGQAIDAGREIPLPGLPDALSQLAVPILARDRVLGVLHVQSPEPGGLSQRDEQGLLTLARYLATSILLVGDIAGADAPAGRAYTKRPHGERAMIIRHHASDDSVFVDEEYLIKGLPGRILVRILASNERDGRVDFSNKELRVDSSLQLGHRDNLEARLVLLRRRLEERSGALRLVKTGRGRFRLELGRPFELVRAP